MALSLVCTIDKFMFVYMLILCTPARGYVCMYICIIREQNVMHMYVCDQVTPRRLSWYNTLRIIGLIPFLKLVKGDKAIPNRNTT